MSDASPSIVDRIRAGFASLLARLGAGAHRLEDWTARGTRPILIALLAIAVLAVGIFAVVHETRGPGGGRHGRPDGEHARLAPAPPPAPKPIGKPAGKPEGKPEGRRGAPMPPPPPAQP